MLNNKKDVLLLDCTLRDGGHVINFDFGENNIKLITSGLCKSGVDVVEVGFLKDGSHSPSQTLYNKVSEAEKFLNDIDRHSEFALMIRPDWYSIEQLERASGKIKNIRFAFYGRDLELTLKQANIARNYGYNVFFNPVNVFSYSEKELVQLLNILNDFGPQCVAIVDTFGSMLSKDLSRIYSIFNETLASTIAISLHLHENLSMSFSLAELFIQQVGGARVAYIDSSILGMGRIPGNLCTELMMNYLNIDGASNYKLSEVYNLIQRPIKNFKKVNDWGYSPEYAITAFGNMHRSYAEHLNSKKDLDLRSIDEILKKVHAKVDRENFNIKLIDSLYDEYIAQNK
jgi:4-hydroxy 2-oxovalerate aldolase